MSKSQRLSDGLVEDAARQAKRFHRSTAQQIEHWARLGQLMEPALSFPVQEKLMDELVKEFDEALEQAESPEVIARTRAYIRSNTGRVIARDA